MGATPVALDAATLPRVARRGQYLVTPKTDGEGCRAYGLGAGDEEYVVTVDRSGRVDAGETIKVPNGALTLGPMGISDASPDPYAGSPSTRSAWATGPSYSSTASALRPPDQGPPFGKRHAAATQLAEVVPVVRTKPFYPAHLAAKALAAKDHPSDGLIFVPCTEPAHPGRQPSLLKWKPVPTVDLRYEGATGGPSSPTTGRRPCRGRAGIHVAKAAGVKLRVGRIFEVAPSENEWRVVKARPDKEVPNTLMTATHTVEAAAGHHRGCPAGGTWLAGAIFRAIPARRPSLDGARKFAHGVADGPCGILGGLLGDLLGAPGGAPGGGAPHPPRIPKCAGSRLYGGVRRALVGLDLRPTDEEHRREAADVGRHRRGEGPAVLVGIEPGHVDRAPAVDAGKLLLEAGAVAAPRGVELDDGGLAAVHGGTGRWG